MKLPVEAHAIIPHRDSMLLIRELTEAAEGRGTATARIGRNGIAVDESGGLDPLAFVELTAQTYAAVKGWELMQDGEEFPIGYLVGVQKFESLGTAKAGDELTIHVETVGQFEGFAVVEGAVRREETLLAELKIKLWVPEDGTEAPL
ncbi:3-hydroxyacyl-ACP dehydratase [Salidesulfovibrio onnuriiensis]|uniref:3-hydroxyacyl-ACP dehydratase n=1 Tax=Salidesulfovibrio onnuriiensis TaxID=2583823 RepID=UPI0011C92EA2|nr:3-hydroxyacyl-ACP dehydratase [Salidesulfovibrio onnuriiensis]